MPHEQSGKGTLQESRSMLSATVQELVPEENTVYYDRTNTMHCDLTQAGGSKFTEIANIFQVLERDGNRIAEAVAGRRDDREQLLAAGADKAAFLPATKSPDDTSPLPEALYYKVDGIPGKLGIIQLKELPPETRVLVRREKSVIEEGKEQVPASYSVIQGTMDDMPSTDFATVIVGREGGGNGP